MSESPIIYAKTAAGHDELKLRERHLGVVARRLLLFVNGVRGQPELERLFAGRIDLDSELAGLEQAGLIARQPSLARPVPTRPMPDSGAGTAPGLMARLFRRGGHTVVLDPIQQTRKRDAGLLLYELLGPGSEDLTLRLDACRDKTQIDRFLGMAVDVVERVCGHAEAVQFRIAVDLPND